MSVYDSLLEQVEGYMCKICGHRFSTAQSLAAHIDSEHLEATRDLLVIRYRSKGPSIG